MIINERDHGSDRRSSSAIAKYADAFAKDLIGLAQFAHLAFQGPDALTVIAGWANPQPLVALRLTHSRATFLLQPIFAAIEPIAAHCKA